MPNQINVFLRASTAAFKVILPDKSALREVQKVFIDEFLFGYGDTTRRLQAEAEKYDWGFATNRSLDNLNMRITGVGELKGNPSYARDFALTFGRAFGNFFAAIAIGIPQMDDYHLDAVGRQVVVQIRAFAQAYKAVANRTLPEEVGREVQRIAAGHRPRLGSKHQELFARIEAVLKE